MNGCRSGRFGRHALLALLAGLLPAASASAQTCASPLPLLLSPSATGDTCTSTNSLNLLAGGALDSPQKDVIYRLDSTTRLRGTLGFGAGTWPNAMAVLMDDCAEGASASAAWDAGTPATLTDLPPGDHFLVVTSAPWSPPTECGAYQLDVDLQEIPDGDCAVPLSFRSGVRHAGDTCGASNPLPSIGPFPSPQPDLVYRIDPADVVDGRLYFDAPDFNMAAMLVSSCSAASDILVAEEFAAGQSGVMDVSGLSGGDRYLVVSASPLEPDDSCGSFGFSDLDPAIATDRTEFLAGLQPGYYLEGFRQVPPGATPQRMDFARNGYAYSVTPIGANAHLQFATDAFGRSLQALTVTSTSAPRSLRIAFSGVSVNAVGGSFWQTGSLAAQGIVTVSFRSGVKVKTYRLRGSKNFRGFRSSRPIDEIAITVSAGSARPTIDDFVVGYAQSP
jgi:hypothetical protein